jgi:hypothetical protein
MVTAATRCGRLLEQVLRESAEIVLTFLSMGSYLVHRSTQRTAVKQRPDNRGAPSSNREPGRHDALAGAAEAASSSASAHAARATSGSPAVLSGAAASSGFTSFARRPRCSWCAACSSCRRAASRRGSGRASNR